MATLSAQTPDGKTLTVEVPQGTDPNSYGALVEDAVKHYSSVSQAQQGSLPTYATDAQQKEWPISSMVAKGLGIGMEALQAPFQAAGEPIRRAITQAQGQDPGPYRAPTSLQRLATVPLLQKMLSGIPQTQQQAPDFISAMVNPAMAGYKGITAGADSLVHGQGIPAVAQAGKQAVAQPPGLPEAALSTAAALGSGEAGNLPFTAAAKSFSQIGKLLETGELAGIPGTGMALKSATEMDAVPLGLENLTAHANPEILQAALKNNVPATPGMLTGSPTLNAIESFGKKIPFASNIFQERFGKIYDAMENMRAPIVETSKPAADLGLDVQQGLSAASNANMGKAKALYANAENTLPAGSQIPVNNLQETASNLLKSQAKLPAGAQASGAGQLLRDLAGSGFEGKNVGQIMPEGGTVTGQAVPAYDYPTLQTLRSELNNRIEQANPALRSAAPGASFQSSPEVRIYTQLKNAVDKDLNDFSDKTGGAFQSAYSEANKTYQTYKQTYAGDKFVQSILAEQNPEKVIDKVVAAAKNNPRALGTLKLNLPTDTLNNLQTYFIKDMTEKVPNVFSPSHFVSQYDSIGEKQLTSILGQDKMDELRPLYVLSRAGVNAERSGQSASGPSGAGMSSAMAIRAPIMAAITGMATGHPIKGALAGAGLVGAEMEGLPMMAKGYLSGPVGKFLTRQSSIVPSFPAASEIAPMVGKLQQPLNSVTQNPANKQALMQLLQQLLQKQQSAQGQP